MTEFLEQYGNWVLFAALIGSFVLIATAEMFFPRRATTPDLGFRWLNNIGLALVTTGVTRVTLVLPGLSAAWWANDQELGLLPWLELDMWPGLLVVLLLMGFADYVIHRLMHCVPFLWRFHAVHHSDTEFDLTTTYRTHPIAALILLFMRLPAVIALGAPLSVMVVHEAIRVVQDLWSHSNTRLPETLDRYLRYVWVTPDFHRLHHSSQIELTNSNFSSALPWFDYLFGTQSTRPFASQSTMQIGLDQHRSKRESRIDSLLLMPLHVSTGRTDPILGDGR